MKKILFVMNTMGRAGAERALIALMNMLPKEQYEISLLVLINRGEIFSEVPKHVKILNRHPDMRSVLSPGGKAAITKTTLRCFFYHLQGFRCMPYLIKNFFLQLKKRRLQPDKLLWRIIANGTPVPRKTYDLAIAYLEGGSTYFTADYVHAKKKASFLHIDYKKAGYCKELDLDAYDKINRIFSVSKEAMESFCAIYPEHREKCFLFRNIIDTKWIKKQSRKPLPASSAFTKSMAKFKLLTVGRLNYQKAYDIAIPALRLLRDQGLDVDWFVLGEGDLEHELWRIIKKENLEKHFFLLGSVKNPYPYYRHATLYVHATRFEGKSIAIEEAQVLGKAIVASDCTGNREQITHNVSGYLTQLSSKAVASHIADLLLHPEKRKRFETASSSVEMAHTEDYASFFDLF